MNKSIAATLLLGIMGIAGLFAGAAHAGEIDIYEHPDFGGRAIALRDATPSLGRVGFNDRASSVVVRGGKWEVCSDDEFNGYCAILDRGEYRRLDGRLNDRISSAREVDGRDRDRDEDGRPRHRGGWERGGQDRGASVTLFSEEGMRGRSMSVTNNVVTLSDANFNDTAASMVIEGGYWELCSDRDFRGQCRVLGPGQYRRLEPGLYRSLSSLRVAQQAGRGGYQQPQQQPGVELFTAPGFGGNRYLMTQDLDNFSRNGFNDQINSFVITGGQWEMCVDAGFRGQCVVFGPGKYANLGRLSGQLSSMRRVD
ncbi:beta/gamma crystallin-related protein [Actimicrobium antarcticum]|uniref:Beta/gamma crystallin 'Greek key' domain-containing protein n=1 Tax=Actimicrobium antarcticum TaxID=1051899 RepID=A0ABP7T3L9_9BURK